MAAMTEDEIMAAALRDVMLAEIETIENMPKHKFSRKFERKMKKLFAQQKAPSKTENKQITLKRKLVVALLVVLISAFVAGCASLAYYLWNHFKVEDYGLYSLLGITDIKDCPTELLEHYELDVEMKGYSKEILLDEYFQYWVAYQKKDEQINISFSQNTKDTYQNIFLNTENALVMPTEVTVNGCKGVFYQTFYGEMLLIWDVGDYILDMTGYGISQEELFALAESIRKVDDV